MILLKIRIHRIHFGRKFSEMENVEKIEIFDIKVLNIATNG